MKENQFDSYSSFLSPLLPFATPAIFPSPATRASPAPPRPPRSFLFTVVAVDFSSSSTSRRNKCATTRVFKKAVSYLRSARLHRHFHHLRLPTLARAIASPPNTAVLQHSRALSSFPFFLRVFSRSFSFLTIYPSSFIPLGRTATTFQITPHSPISFLFVLSFSPFSRSFYYSSLGDGLRLSLLPLIVSSLVSRISSFDGTFYAYRAEDERVRRTNSASEGGEDTKS